MKITVLFGVFGLVLTWLEPTESQRDKRVPPTILSIIPEKYYMLVSSGPVSHQCDRYSGTPPPKIYWQLFKNGKSTPMRLYPDPDHNNYYNGTQLILKYIEPNNRYQCVAENPYGTALSGKMQILLAKGARFDPDLKKKPERIFEDVGKPLSIPCAYISLGDPENNYYWKFQVDSEEEKAVQLDDRIFVSLTGSLVFSYLKKTDGKKTYTCYIKSTALSSIVYGSWTVLEVMGNKDAQSERLTFIYSTPNMTVATYKKPFKMQCIFGGSYLSKIEWTKPSIRQPLKRINESFNNELVISSVAEEDEGFYKCTTKQGLTKSLNAVFYINVKSAPIWVKKPASLVVAEGQEGVFHCDARPLRGEKLLPKPKWYKNGQLLDITPGGIKDRTHLSADGKTITIHDAQKRNDICNYQCYVMNDEGEIFADAAFNVILNTNVLVAPQSQTIEKGAVVMFDISAETDPLVERYLKYHWILNGRKIEFLDLFDIYLLPNNSLVINTTGMDENRFQIVLGNYSVNISNGVETVTKYASLMGNPVKNPVISQSGMDLRWIALIVAVVLLFIIFILLLCVLFNRQGGDDYSVDKKERKAGHDPEKELADSGFHDLPRTDDDPDKQKPDNVSISSAAKSMGSETDSMEEYSDADAGSRFNEDGSFIGAYQGHESKGNVSNV